jgi:Sec-independent protein translocase protein TatA
VGGSDNQVGIARARNRAKVGKRGFQEIAEKAVFRPLLCYWQSEIVACAAVHKGEIPMKRCFEWVQRHWAKIAIAIAVMLLGGFKVKRKARSAKRAGDLYRFEVKKDLDTLSDANREAKKTAQEADQVAANAKEKFKERLDEISNSDDDLSDILSEYNHKRLQ